MTLERELEINQGIIADAETHQLSNVEFLALKPMKVGRSKAEVIKMPLSLID